MYKSTEKCADLHILMRNFFRKQKKYVRTANTPPSPAFQKRLRPLKRFIGMLVIILLFWSALTESLFLFSGFLNITDVPELSAVLTLLFITIIECCKYFLGTYCFRFLTHGWLRDGMRYVLSFLIILPLSIATFYASIYLSVNGAPQVVEFVKEQTTPEFIINKDSIHSRYDTLAAKIELDKANAKKTTWRGVTTTHATVLLQKYEDRLSDIEVQRENALGEARRKEQEAKNDFSDDSEYWGDWFARFGGYGEGLTLLLLFFLEVYHRAVYKEKELLLAFQNEKLETERNEDETERNTNETERSERSDSPKRNAETISEVEIESTESVPISTEVVPIQNGTDEDTKRNVPERSLDFAGKTYTELQFKDFIRKIKYRTKNNKTEVGREKNQALLTEILAVWEAHEQE